jgi:hypothetical protein
VMRQCVNKPPSWDWQSTATRSASPENSHGLLTIAKLCRFAVGRDSQMAEGPRALGFVSFAEPFFGRGTLSCAQGNRRRNPSNCATRSRSGFGDLARIKLFRAKGVPHLAALGPRALAAHYTCGCNACTLDQLGLVTCEDRFPFVVKGRPADAFHQ